MRSNPKDGCYQQEIASLLPNDRAIIYVVIASAAKQSQGINRSSGLLHFVRNDSTITYVVIASVAKQSQGINKDAIAYQGERIYPHLPKPKDTGKNPSEISS